MFPKANSKILQAQKSAETFNQRGLQNVTEEIYYQFFKEKKNTAEFQKIRRKCFRRIYSLLFESKERMERIHSDKMSFDHLNSILQNMPLEQLKKTRISTIQGLCGSYILKYENEKRIVREEEEIALFYMALIHQKVVQITANRE